MRATDIATFADGEALTRQDLVELVQEAGQLARAGDRVLLGLPLSSAAARVGVLAAAAADATICLPRRGAGLADALRAAHADIAIASAADADALADELDGRVSPRFFGGRLVRNKLRLGLARGLRVLACPSRPRRLDDLVHAGVDVLARACARVLRARSARGGARSPPWRAGHRAAAARALRRRAAGRSAGGCAWCSIGRPGGACAARARHGSAWHARRRGRAGCRVASGRAHASSALPRRVRELVAALAAASLADRARRQRAPGSRADQSGRAARPPRERPRDGAVLPTDAARARSSRAARALADARREVLAAAQLDRPARPRTRSPSGS